MPVARVLSEVGVEEFAQWKALYVVEGKERAGEWTQQDELLGVLIEVVQEWMYALTMLTARQKLKSLPGKVTIPRPKAPVEHDSMADVKKAIQMFQQIGR